MGPRRNSCSPRAAFQAKGALVPGNGGIPLSHNSRDGKGRFRLSLTKGKEGAASAVIELAVVKRLYAREKAGFPTLRGLAALEKARRDRRKVRKAG